MSHPFFPSSPRRRGASGSEYGLGVGLVGAAALATLLTAGGSIDNIFDDNICAVRQVFNVSAECDNLQDENPGDNEFAGDPDKTVPGDSNPTESNPQDPLAGIEFGTSRAIRDRTVFSRVVTLGDTPDNAVITVGNGNGTEKLSVNGGPWTTSASVSGGENIQLRLDAGSGYDVNLPVSVSIAGSQTNWTVKYGSMCLYAHDSMGVPYYPNYKHLALADFDGDGDIDVGRWNGYWENDGQGKFDIDKTDSVGFSFPLDTADFNGDGTPDQVYHKAYVSITGGQRKKLINDIDIYPYGQIAGDFDGDGDADVIVTGRALNLHILFYENDGSANFTKRTLFEIDYNETLYEGVYSLYSVAHDFDKDGVDEFGVFRSEGIKDGFGDENERFVMYDFENGEFIKTQTLNMPSEARPEKGDINGDGHIDLLFHAGHDRIRYYKNDGSGNFSFAGRLPEYPNGKSSRVRWRDAAIADLDGDGDGDVITTSADLSVIWWNLGGFNLQQSTYSSKFFSYHLTNSGVNIADFTGDGKPEPLMIRHDNNDYNPRGNYLFRNECY